MHVHLTRTHRVPGTPGQNMTRPGACVAAVPQVSARYYPEAQVIQEEAVYSDGVGRDTHSGLCCLWANARPDGGSKARTLAWALEPVVIADVEQRALATRLEAGSAGP